MCAFTSRDLVLLAVAFAQADWLLPSSREDVLGGEEWNQLLREQVRFIMERGALVTWALVTSATACLWRQPCRRLPQVPAAFAQAITIACSAPAAASAAAAAAALQQLQLRWPRLLPPPSAQLGFFRPLAARVPAALRALACVPTVEGGLALPGDVLLASQVRVCVCVCVGLHLLGHLGGAGALLLGVSEVSELRGLLLRSP